ncbi:Glucose-responsive transcription factor [Ascosphaera acerosa]|nr:Glucose-responsive transcription factor [Ascosphaera acerosa]
MQQSGRPEGVTTALASTAECGAAQATPPVDAQAIPRSQSYPPPTNIGQSQNTTVCFADQQQSAGQHLQSTQLNHDQHRLSNVTAPAAAETADQSPVVQAQTQTQTQAQAQALQSLRSNPRIDAADLQLSEHLSQDAIVAAAAAAAVTATTGSAQSPNTSTEVAVAPPHTQNQPQPPSQPQSQPQPQPTPHVQHQLQSEPLQQPHTPATESLAQNNQVYTHTASHGVQAVLHPQQQSQPGDAAHHASAQLAQHTSVFSSSPTAAFPPSQQVGVEPHHDLSYGENSARKKRSKVSRACDECRRKKVRCDASAAVGAESCTNCRRMNSACEFSRVPMKRGPSKGYIKELAERINTLESQLHPTQQQVSIASPVQHEQQEIIHEPPFHAVHSQSSQGFQECSPAALDHTLMVEAAPAQSGLTKKRTYSISEGLNHAYLHPQVSGAAQTPGVVAAKPSPSSVGGWVVQNGIGTSVDKSLSDAQTSSVTANGQATGLPPFWASPLHNSAFTHDGPSEGNAITARRPESAIALDPQALDRYYAHIHGYYPVLPRSPRYLDQIMSQCPRHIQSMLAQSLLAVTVADAIKSRNETSYRPPEQALQETGFDPNEDDLQHAQDRLYTLLRTTTVSTRNQATNMVLAMTLLLMAIEADSRGPDNLRGRNGLPKSTLLDEARVLSHWLCKEYQVLRRYVPSTGKENAGADGERGVDSKCVSGESEASDTDAAVARRLWVATAIMTRWHAFATGTCDVFESVVIASAETNDEGCLSPGQLQLARYSTVLSEIYGLAFDLAAVNVCSSPALRRILLGQLARVGDVYQPDVPPSMAAETDTHVRLTLSPMLYWSIALLVRRHVHLGDATGALYAASVLVDRLAKHYSCPLGDIDGQQLSRSTGDDVPRQSPFDVHVLSLAALTLLELTDHPAQSFKKDAWSSLGKLRAVLDARSRLAAAAACAESGRSSIFRTPGWDASIVNLILAKASSDPVAAVALADSAGSVPPTTAPAPQADAGTTGPADIAGSGGGNADQESEQSLQHLADLAVGAGATAANVAPTNDANASHRHRAPELRPQAAQDAVVYIDLARLTREGYLNVLAGL